MEEAPENSKELLHSAHANGMNERITTSNTQPISLYPSAAQITPLNVSDSYIPTLLSESNSPITVITGTNSN